MEEIVIDSKTFDKMSSHLKPHLKDNCNYCGIKITGDTFGFLSREITCCKKLICLSQAVEDSKELDAKRGNQE